MRLHRRVGKYWATVITHTHKSQLKKKKVWKHNHEPMSFPGGRFTGAQLNWWTNIWIWKGSLYANTQHIHQNGLLVMRYATSSCLYSSQKPFVSFCANSSASERSTICACKSKLISNLFITVLNLLTNLLTAKETYAPIFLIDGEVI